MNSHGERRDHPRCMARLPTEVEGLVVSQLRDDKPALATCSLVNESWLQQSRSFLFADVVVKAASTAHFHSFLDLLGTARYARESIQTLTLQAGPPRSSAGMWASPDSIRAGWPAVDRALLRAIGAKLPKLKRMRLTQVRFTDAGSEHSGCSETASASDDENLTGYGAQQCLGARLEQLRLSGLGYMPKAEIPSMLSSLSAFAQIDELELYHLKTSQPLKPDRINGEAPLAPDPASADVGTAFKFPVPIVRSFKFSASHATAIEFARLVYSMLANRGDLGALTSLSWAGDDWMALEEIAPFLQATAPHLRSLRLNMGTWVFEGRRSPPGSPRFYTRWDGIIKLSDMPMLESLTLTYDAPPERRVSQMLYPVFSSYTYLLSHTPPSLRRLVLRFPLPDDEQRWNMTKDEYQQSYLDRLTKKRALWDELDLTLDRLSTLETTEVVFSSRWDEMIDPLGPLVAQSMRRVQARGILRVSWQDAPYSFQ
ncbi:hypothetical protein C8T65DRAFT_640756 [Cerioporus squamosus]|nr:hypothetical protein C8T65DRAFT_640756 [Cerioporus squamosus]